jgi:alpha/beta hydrolase family protein
LPAGEIDVRMRDAWIGGSIGTVTLDEVHQALRDRVGLDEEQLAAFMADMWREYLGTANTELIEYARGLRLISYDRPGYGESTSQPGRTMADCAADVRAICAALGIERLVTRGYPGGGPHVPVGHAQWLAARIPGVEARFYDHEGHGLRDNRVAEVHAWLAERL